jgi:23S rRNA (uracil1939-C5)-methyltransferase
MAFTAVEELSKLQAPAWHPRDGGVLRTVLVRQSQGTGQTHVVLVAAEEPEDIDRAAARIHARSATTVSLNLNTGPTDQLLGRDTRVLVGPPRIEERIAGLRYAISPDAFFQTAPFGAGALVDLVLQWLRPTPASLVADLYCGGGLFALPLAQQSQRVIGIEQGFSAVLDAQHSAAWNGIANAEFVHAAVDAELRRWQRQPRPDLIVLDPPREGCGEEVAAAVAQLRPLRVAYVSCDAQALGKDLAVFAAHGLRAVRVTPVDMFPHTAHIEAVAMLERSR